MMRMLFSLALVVATLSASLEPEAAAQASGPLATSTQAATSLLRGARKVADASGRLSRLVRLDVVGTRTWDTGIQHPLRFAIDRDNFEWVTGPIVHRLSPTGYRSSVDQPMTVRTRAQQNTELSLLRMSLVFLLTLPAHLDVEAVDGGVQSIDGRDVRELTVRRRGAVVFSLLLDPKSSRAIGYRTTQPDQRSLGATGPEMAVTCWFESFRRVDGIEFPVAFKESFGRFKAVTAITDIRTFSTPAKPQGAKGQRSACRLPLGVWLPA